MSFIFGFPGRVLLLALGQLGKGSRSIALILASLLSSPGVFATSEVLQQFNAISSAETFRGGSIPPDSHGAIGPKGILSSVNLGLEYYSKSTNHSTLWIAPLANNLISAGTNSFWSANAGYTALNISDPKVVFDPDTQRFFLIMQENTGTQSFLNIAVSRNSDPRTPSQSDWLFYRFEVTDTWSFPGFSDEKVGIDYPGIEVDHRTLTVAYNAFALSQVNGLNGAENRGSRMFVFDKLKLATGLRDTPRIWKNQAPFDLPLLENDTTTIQPAQPIGKSDPGNRIFAVELHHEFPYLDGNWSIRLHVINDPLGSFSYQYDDVPIDSPNDDPGGAPQPFNAAQPTSGAGVDTVALRPISACYFNNKIWLVYTQKGDRGNSVVHWVCILPRERAHGGTILVEDGYIDGGPGVWTYLPTLSAGPYGDLCLIYTQSSASEAPSIYYTFRPTDSPWDTPVKLQGSSNPTQTVSPPKSINRWGDYAAVAIDPRDYTFWVTHEYVNSPATNSWQTFWAQIAACRWPVINFRAQPVITTSCVSNVNFTLGVRSVTVELDDTPVGPPEVDYYIWRRNGVPITAGNRFLVESNLVSFSGGSLTISKPGFGDEGFYDAKIINACGDKYATYSDPVPLLIGPIPSWTTLETDPRPVSRVGQNMVYDDARGVCLLFGGSEAVPVNGDGNDTWLWDGQSWSPTFPSVSPPRRAYHSLAYDSNRQRVVLFGGSFYDGTQRNKFGDTWEWDGRNWKLMAAASTNTPPARNSGSMAYDPVRGQTLLISGDLVSYTDRVTTWGWNGTNWSILSTNLPNPNPDRSNYDVNYNNAMAFDERRGVMVLFAPFFNSSGNAVMEWDGTAWGVVASTGITPTNNPNSYQGVLDSRGYRAYYDNYRGMVACVGGGGFNNAIWYWDGSQFYGFDPQIDGVASNISFVNAGMAFDRKRRALVWSGDGSLGPNRTREIRFNDAPVILEGPSPTFVEIGKPLTLRVAVTGPGALKYQWTFNGAPLASDSRITGLDTPTLTITPAQPSDSGQYALTVTGQCAQISSPSARVAVGPILNILRTATGYTLSWTTPSAAIEDAPTVLGPWNARPDLASPFELPIQKTGQRFFRLHVPGQ